MKDKELREKLVEAGVVREHRYEGISYLQAVHIENKINAIVDYLGIELTYAPSTIIAKKKAPQSACE